MKVGDCVNLCTYGPTTNSYVVLERGLIIAAGTSNDINTQACYDVWIDNKIAQFYMKPQLWTRFHLNVGDNVFWIEPHFLD